jgi:hypothetical protein
MDPLAMIPVFDYRPTYLAHKQEIDEAIARVLESGQLILGPEVDAFETEFAALADPKVHQVMGADHFYRGEEEAIARRVGELIASVDDGERQEGPRE